MIIIKHPSLLKEFVDRRRSMGLAIGFVPTMGALHNGHLDLVQTCAAQCDVTICSIFINPTQFNDPADFKKYPQTLEKDIKMLESSAADVLFSPGAEEVYPGKLDGLEKYDLGYLETVFEGKYRPGHFQGVCQVMRRLLELTLPDKLFMGQKDYQQCMVVRRLLGHLHFNVQLIQCATVREADGLAMSSRNLRLTPQQRSLAPFIFQTMTEMKNNLVAGSLSEILQKGLSALQEKGFRTDYLAIADAQTLLPADHWDGRQSLVILAAAFLGEVRLIDNLLL